jgi:predicted dehydrogenase
MATRTIRIVVDGATGRLGGTQHLRSLLAIRAEGGLPLRNGDRLVPEPILLGRNAEKLAGMAVPDNLAWSTDRDACLADTATQIYFDATSTAGRIGRAKAAVAAGKHIYLEKPIAETLDDALALARAADRAGVKHGTVQDKIFLPGLHKLAKLRGSGFFGKILSAQLDFGWWVFDGEHQPAQRPSWNYKKREGGGLVLDMFPHWRYIVDRLIGDITGVSCRLATQIPRRRDEAGKLYDVDVEDTALAIFELSGGALVHVTSSWCTRVKRDDMMMLQIDGTDGSAVCGLHRCYVQPLAATPKPLFNIETPRSENFDDQWQEVPDTDGYRNPYREGWELFLRHVGEDAPFPYTLLEGAKGVQLADACYRSHAEKRWIELDQLTL